jgi:hypothetical protein
MHPELMYQAQQAHVADLRREAVAARRANLFLRRSADAHLLTRAMHRILIFAEHRPTTDELDVVLDHLTPLEDDLVTAVLHHRPHRAVPDPLMAAKQHLAEVLERLEGAGHRAHGRVVEGPVRQALVSAVHEPSPEAVILVTERHLLSHLAHHDLEHLARHHTSIPVLAVAGGVPHLV